MGKLEEVARALAELQIRIVNRWEKPPLTDEDVKRGVDHAWTDFVQQARAAIEAMRRPTPEMLEAGCAAYEPSLGEDRFVSETGIERVWNAMLARALKDA